MTVPDHISTASHSVETCKSILIEANIIPQVAVLDSQDELSPTSTPTIRPRIAPRRPSTSPHPNHTGIVVFSGGSAANKLVDIFEEVCAENNASLTYVVPISDNGGSSSEIIRVFGGPGIGDIRSRLVRLIPDNGSAENTATKALFGYRLPSDSAEAATEWDTILNGTHPVWKNISSPKLQLIRSIFNSFNFEAIKRTRTSSRFDFGAASLGNIFLTGARLFTGSFEAAIYLLSSVCSVPKDVDVMPSLNTNFAHHIAAGLANGDVIMGQNNISHPGEPTAIALTCTAGDDDDLLSPENAWQRGRGHAVGQHEDDEDDGVEQAEDANLPGSLPALRKAAIAFSKEHDEDLPARIERLWYINPYGQEIRISANPRALDALGKAGTVIYSIGSLFTSIVPSLVLKGVGAALLKPEVRNKVLILNATVDREVGPSTNPFDAIDFVKAITNACLQSLRPGGRLKEGDESTECRRFVTHLIYLDGPSSPKVDRKKLADMSIECLRVYGPNGGSPRYDDAALRQTLKAIVGMVNANRSRRNTLMG